MSIAHHKIQAGVGPKVTLLALQVSACTVTMAGLKGDELVFETVVDSTNDGPAFDAGDFIRLFDGENACRFFGIMQEPEPVIRDKGEGWVYRVRGGDYLLDAVPYRQPWRFPTDIPIGPVTPETEMTQEMVSLVTLNRDYDDGSKVNLQEQVGAALDQAVEEMGDNGITLGYSLTNLPAIDPAEDELRDQSVLDVLEACLLWCPHVTARWDYSSSWPVLRFSAALAINGAGVAIAGGSVSGLGFVTRTMPVTAMVACAPRARYDRLVKQVKISYLIVHDVMVGEDRVIYRTVERDTSTIANGSLIKREITVPLRGLIYDGESFSAPEPRPDDGIARALHQAFARVWWECDFAVVAQDVNWDYKVGEGWLITGTGANLAASNSIAQVITRDVMTGTTRVVTGPPGHLGYDGLVALNLANRLRRVPARAGQQQYGFGDDEEKGSDGANEVTIGIEDGGVPTDYIFKARPAAT